MVALDERRLADDGHRLDDVRVQSTLPEKINLPELGGLLFEHIDEGCANDLSLVLGFDDARKPREKPIGCVGEYERKIQPLEPFSDLRGLVQPEHAVVNQDAREVAPDGAMNDERRHRRIHAAAKTADHSSAANLRLHARRRLLHK